MSRSSGKGYYLLAYVFYCISVMVALVLLSGTWLLVHQNSKSVEQVESKLASAEADIKALQTELEKAVARTRPADDYLKIWAVHEEVVSNIGAVLSSLTKKATESGLSVGPTDTDVREDYQVSFMGVAPVTMRVQKLSIVVYGDYYALLNWFGFVESQFPIARVDVARISSSESGLSLEVSLSFPRFESLEAKAKPRSEGTAVR